MVIGEFNESYPPLMDGVGQVVRNYTHGLNALGEKTYAVVAGDGDALSYDRQVGEVNTVRARMYPLPQVAPYGPVIKSKAFKKKVSSISFDIVHSHSPFYLGSFAHKIAKKKHVPHVTTFHSQFRDDIQGAVHVKWITDIAVKYILRHYDKADEVWVPSRATGEKLKEYGYKGEYVVMENGCDMKIPDEKEYFELRQKGLEFLNIQNIDMPVLLYIGQHKVEKNLMMALESLKILHERGYAFLMLFAGIGPDKPAMEDFVRANGLSDNIRFLGRITDRKILESLYALASLFLFPSFYDTSCLVMREAAAFSLPVLFVKGSCTSEGIKDGVNGFLADNTPESFASKIMAVTSDASLLDSAGLGARSTLYRSWEMVACEVRERYKQIIRQFNNK